MGQLVGNYCKARKSVRQAAEAAGTVRERVVKGDDLKVRTLATVVCAWKESSKETSSRYVCWLQWFLLGLSDLVHTYIQQRIGERPPQQQITGPPSLGQQ